MPEQFFIKITEIMSEKKLQIEFYSVAGAAGKFGITASSICSCAFISVDSSTVFLGIAKLDTNDKTIRAIAKVQVAFSRKSVVFFAPII
jgi:hypothetical protein